MQAEVRPQARELLNQDRSFLQWVTESDPAREARRVRARLGGQDRIGRRLARIIFRLKMPILIVLWFVVIPTYMNPSTVLHWVCTVSVFLMLMIDVRWLDRPVLTPHYTTVLRGHDIVACLECGYHVANQAPEPTCPECGLEDPLAR